VLLDVLAEAGGGGGCGCLMSMGQEVRDRLWDVRDGSR